MTKPEERAPFATADAEAVIETICRDEEEGSIMTSVLYQLAAIWAGSAPAFAGCHLAEAGISVDRMLDAVRALATDEVITVDESAWMTDQVASAGAEIEGDADPELCRIQKRLGELKALRTAERKRMIDLKVAILERCEAGELAALLEQDPAAYAAMTEAGERSINRLMTRLRRRAA